MHQSIVTIVLALGFCLPTAHAAEEEVVVEATRILDQSIEASRSVSIVDQNQIKSKNTGSVADLLRELPGVDVVRQGTVGQTTSIFIRGARSEDTLVLIDGVVANDAMAPGGGYDFSYLTPENIERIEVYRGPQSVRFGGGALGGVINIVTKEGKGATSSRYLVEGGSYGTWKGEAGVSGQVERFKYSTAVEGLQTQGFSAASQREGNSEPDGAKVGSASTKLTWQQDRTSAVNATLRYTKAGVDLDRHGGTGGDDPNYTALSSQLLTGVSAERRFLDERLKSSVGVYYAETTRSDTNLPDTMDSTSMHDSFLSENMRLDSNHEYIFDDHNTLRVNLAWQTESGTSSSVFNGSTTAFPRQSHSEFGEGVTYLYESSTWFGDAGVRFSEHSHSGTIPSGRLSFGRAFAATGSQVSLTYGTGYKVPSLFQLYSSYGAANLRSERSDTWELTFEQKINSRVGGSIAFFRNKFRNMIDYNFTTNKYDNVASAETAGAELQAGYTIVNGLKLTMNYTYLKAIDKTTGQTLVRRPISSANLGLRSSYARFEGYAEGQFKGVRADLDANGSRVEDSAFLVFNCGVSYALSPAFKLNGRIQNLFNQSYEEVAGYGTPGLSFYLGVNGTL